MSLFHRIALAAALLALPQTARGQEASPEALLTEQIAADVAREHAACTYQPPSKVVACSDEVNGAQMLLDQYNSSLSGYEGVLENSILRLQMRIEDARTERMPLPLPPVLGEREEDAQQRKAAYQQQVADATAEKGKAEEQCQTKKTKIGAMATMLRAHYQTEFGKVDKDFPFLARYPSYDAVKKAMFAMLDRYQKEVDSISCAVVR